MVAKREAARFGDRPRKVGNMMRKSISALVAAIFVSGVVASATPAVIAMPSKTAAKSAAAKTATTKTKIAATTKPAAKPAAKPVSKTEKGLTKGLTKATKFVKRTVTVPQKNPKASKRNPNRKDSNLVKGVKTSAHKAGKWIKGRTKLK